MYGIFTYIYHKNQPNVGKYIIHYHTWIVWERINPINTNNSHRVMGHRELILSEVWIKATVWIKRGNSCLQSKVAKAFARKKQTLPKTNAWNPNMG